MAIDSISGPDLAVSEFRTLTELLAGRAHHQPHQTAFTYLVDGENERTSVTYAELDLKARVIGCRLQSSGAEGQRVLLLYPSGLEYISAFFGCLYAGAVAVPVYPPRPNQSIERLQNILEDSKAAIGLTDERTLSKISPILSRDLKLKRLRWITTDKPGDENSRQWRDPRLTSDALALLQYTSGSISSPKGVQLTHENLLKNEQMIQKVFNQSSRSVIVSWLPLYHDMGLIGNVIQPVYLGAACVFMSPMAFLQRPFRWLSAISRCNATTSGAPNFAYDLCVRRITEEQRESLNLSNWSVAFNGSEPVRADTLDMFSEAFKACGFKREAFRPCYGLAEATLLVSGATPNLPAVRMFQTAALERNRVLEIGSERGGLDDLQARPLVSCGDAPEGSNVIIVRPETRSRCFPDEIGEIWVSGPGVARGYFNQPAETAEIFNAYVSDDGDGPYLRTGDLGFKRGRELFVTGRLKDLMIVHGLNYYPQDFESIVERCHPACRIHSGAAFTAGVDGEDGVVLLQEVDSLPQAELNGVIEAVRQEIAKHFDLQIHSIVLVKPGQLPRTSSGKIRRRACLESFLSGKLVKLAIYAPPQPSVKEEAETLDFQSLLAIESKDRRAALDAYLRGQISTLLKSPISLSNMSLPLSYYGFDSLMAAELMNRIEQDLNIRIPMVDALQAENLEILVDRALDQFTKLNDSPNRLFVNDEDSTMEEPIVPLSPTPGANDGLLSYDQERLWVLDRFGRNKAAYSVTASLHLNGSLDMGVLRRCFSLILQRHEILRAVFRRSNDGLVRDTLPCNDILLSIIDLRVIPEDERRRRAQFAVTEMAQLPFDLVQGPLFRTVLFQFDKNESHLALNAHHIISDYWSMTVLAREFNALYESISNGIVHSLERPPIQYADYVRWQRTQTDQWEKSLSYWETRLAGAQSLFPDKVESPDAGDSRRSERHLFKLSPRLSNELRELSQQTGATLFMTLLAAYKVVLHHCSGMEDILVAAPTDGRFRAELTNLIGFFAYPLALRTDLSGDPTFRELTARVRETAYEAYERQETPFAKVVEVLSRRRITSYKPLFQAMFSLVKAPKLIEGASGLKITLSDIQNGPMDMQLFLTIIDEGSYLRGSISYDAEFFDVEVIQAIIQSYVQTLDRCVQRRELRLSQFKLNEYRSLEKYRRKISEQNRLIAVASTFTAEPLENSLSFWMEELNVPFKIEFAPYNQIFQELLNPSSLLSKNRGGFNIVLVRFEDWLLHEDTPPFNGRSNADNLLEENISDLISALKSAAEHAAVTSLVCLTPASETALADHRRASLFERLEVKMASELRGANGIVVIPTSEINALYPVIGYSDDSGYELARIPYTSLFYTSLGTIIARKMRALLRPPYKVIVLDCDQTIWKGYCGEDGASGIIIDSYRKLLQEFMLGQRQAGMLICLCSKNNEEDVLEVLERRSEMILKREHLVSWRINWKSKSENIRSLSEELQLDLNSFIFIDDDFVECEEVRANCPEVLTLRLPEQPRDIAAFLKHVWAFDHLRVTEEDQNRSILYQQNIKRETFRRTFSSFDQFLESLDIKVKYSQLEARHIARVSELTHRVNQFNLTSIRRSESDLQRLGQSKESEVLVVEVSDRFGDYGIVGVIISKEGPEAIEVDTFLLSCRALGRTVERQMLARLRDIATERGLKYIDLPYTSTAKNAPAYSFLNSLNCESKQLLDSGWLFKIPAAERSSRLSTEPSEPTPSPDTTHHVERDGNRALVNGISDVALLSRIAVELRDPERIQTAINAWRRIRSGNSRQLDRPYLAPRTPTEKIITQIWVELLQRETVGVLDNYFELGGHSLVAMQILSRTRDAFALDLSLAEFFETPTIASMAAVIEKIQIRQAHAGELARSLNELEALSDDDVRRLLAQENALNGNSL